MRDEEGAARGAAAGSGRVALVTGAGAGIGKAIAERLAHDGCAVALADMNAEAAEAAAAGIAAAGGRAIALQADVSDEPAVAAMVAATAARLGRLDILVSNAGIGGTKPFLDTPLDYWQRVLAVNLTGTFLCGQAAARLMVRQGGGRIVNIASISGLRASAGRTAYGTSKGGVIALTQQMAIELAPLGITVNAVAPGPVDTDLTRAMHTQAVRDTYTAMVPLGRYGSTQEIAAAVAFLASAQASYVNGQILAVDGGFIAAGMLTEA